MKDLINRQEAIDEIRIWKTKMTVEGLVDHIKALPSVQPKIGRWVPGGYDLYYLVCSCCGYQRYDYYETPKAKYCENCGAKMEFA